MLQTLNLQMLKRELSQAFERWLECVEEIKEMRVKVQRALAKVRCAVKTKSNPPPSLPNPFSSPFFTLSFESLYTYGFSAYVSFGFFTVFSDSVC